MSGIEGPYETESAGDVCMHCGIPNDDHTVRAFREHNNIPFESQAHKAFDTLKMVMTETGTIKVGGTMVFSLLTERPGAEEDSELVPAIGFRFMVTVDDKEQFLPDIVYPCGAELINFANLVSDACRTALGAGLKQYLATKEQSNDKKP